MSRLTPEAAKSVLEDRVTKIVKAMQVLVKDAPKIADALDEEARLKTEAFLLSHFQTTMRELALAANFSPTKTSFSLDAPLVAVAPKAVPVARPTSMTLTTPSVPDTVEPQSRHPSVPRPAEAKPWRAPIGRLVGTKEPIYGETEAPRAAGDDPLEKPDPKHGGIAEAGFIDA